MKYNVYGMKQMQGVKGQCYRATREVNPRVRDVLEFGRRAPPVGRREEGGGGRWEEGVGVERKAQPSPRGEEQLKRLCMMPSSSRDNMRVTTQNANVHP